ncbi:carboxymuconolactone decarboxylase family protein [Serratia marcescens]|uniref:carboxymuconolactone decarboxylase family protein n=1 Tax=Serratia marcescens TaxID=615 RepID=UPI00313D8BC7|nr:alkyl hydroperoxide reductase AhpD [Serratia marcescens]
MGVRIDYTRTSSAGVQAFSAIDHYLCHCGLDERLRDLINLRVSQINGCAYCTDLHTRMLMKEGVGAEKLAALQGWVCTEGIFSLKERAALAWAEYMTLIAPSSNRREHVPDLRRYFSDEEVCDLTLAISLINAYNRLAISFRNIPQAVLEHQT